MDNIILALGVVFPLMAMMLVGYELRKFHITDEHSLDVMNKMIFKVFLPFLLFLNIYSLEVEEALKTENLKLLAITALCVIVAVIFSHFLFPAWIKDRRKCSVVIQGIFRSNLILFGIPIAASIYGEQRIGTVSLLAACIVPLYNVLAVTLFEVYRGGKAKAGTVLLGIAKNPLIIASALAFLFILFGIPIPAYMKSALNSMSQIATPLAFIVLGGTFHFDRLTGNIKYLIMVTLGKLVVLPGIVFTIACLLGFRNEALVALIGAMAAPTAVSSFTMAAQMDADAELAGQVVVVTSVASILTIFIWVLVLKSLHLI